MKVSIIIPYKIFNKHVEECLDWIRNINYKDYEVILLPDKRTTEDKKYKVIETGNVKPSTKRNIGVKNSSGEIIAFIDSDAYPEKDWLQNALRHFDDSNVGIVGGPNLTPKDANIWEKTSGDCLSMFICSGKAAIRYKVRKKLMNVGELPTCNLLIRKELFEDFDENLLTAEDTKLCFQVKEKDKKILYVPNVIVYHHRRNSFFKHLKQMWTYGRDIALLIKKKFSFDKLYYFVLAFWVLFLFIGSVISILNEIFRKIFFGIILTYIIFIFISSLIKNLRRSILIFVMIIFTHLSYGFGFIYGMIKK